jgi:hypothetical protein
MLQMKSAMNVQAHASHASASAAKGMGLGAMSYNDAVQRLTPHENQAVQAKPDDGGPDGKVDCYKLGKITGFILSSAAAQLKNGAEPAALAASVDAELAKGLAVVGLSLPGSSASLFASRRFNDGDAMKWVKASFPEVFANNIAGDNQYNNGFPMGWAGGGSAATYKKAATDAYNGKMPAEKTSDKSESPKIARPGE